MPKDVNSTVDMDKDYCFTFKSDTVNTSFSYLHFCLGGRLDPPFYLLQIPWERIQVL